MYRIKHILTNYYYTPGEINLTKTGKIYSIKNSILHYDKSSQFIFIKVRFSSKIYKFLKDIYGEPTCNKFKIPKSDFEMENVNL